jgi:hypothetical protein
VTGRVGRAGRCVGWHLSLTRWLGPAVQSSLDPASRPNVGADLGMFRGELVAGDDLDVRLGVDGVLADSDFSIPATVYRYRVDFDPEASVVRLDQQ